MAEVHDSDVHEDVKDVKRILTKNRQLATLRSSADTVVQQKPQTRSLPWADDIVEEITLLPQRYASGTLFPPQWFSLSGWLQLPGNAPLLQMQNWRYIFLIHARRLLINNVAGPQRKNVFVLPTRQRLAQGVRIAWPRSRGRQILIDGYERPPLEIDRSLFYPAVTKHLLLAIHLTVGSY